MGVSFEIYDAEKDSSERRDLEGTTKVKNATLHFL